MYLCLNWPVSAPVYPIVVDLAQVSPVLFGPVTGPASYGPVLVDHDVVSLALLGLV